jgi:hypothetical protein
LAVAPSDGGAAGADGCVGVPLPSPSGGPFPALGAPGGASPPITFVDPYRAQNETWTLSWEGVIPGTARPLGRPLAGGKFVDPAAAFCGRGVRAGDVLLLTGCNSDSDCDLEQACTRDPSAPLDVTTGLCLDRLNKNPSLVPTPALLQACGPILRARRRFRILSARQGVTAVDPNAPAGMDVSDQLALAELYQPESVDDTHTCTSDADCSDVCMPVIDPNGTTVTAPASCLLDSDGQKRCLRGCDPAGDARCGQDYQCTTSSLGDARCLRAPLDDNLITRCLTELQPYEIHVGNAFLVSGTGSGYLADVVPDPVSRECTVPSPASEYARLRQWRIPIHPPLCSAQVTASAPLTPNGYGTPAACEVPGFGASRVIHYENPIFTLLLDLRPRLPPIDTFVPPDGLQLSFIVVGGGRPLAIGLGVESSLPLAQQPRAAVVAPDGQTVYVVDEGKQSTATGLRGQLLRFSSISQQTDPTFKVR